ncbi:MAG: glycoside hydrolase family 16 protein [Cyanobacteria bacterium P01_H01_bin.74]
MMTSIAFLKQQAFGPTACLWKESQALTLSALLGLLLSVLLVLAASAAPPPLKDGKSWQLKFSDDFSAPQLNRYFWQTCYEDNKCHHWDNFEKQWYAVSHVVPHKNGLALIATKQGRRNVQVSDDLSEPVYVDLPYTSGMLASSRAFDFQYGYFEIEAKIPQGKGLWPAFWLKPRRDWPPEIDIFENLGHDPDTIYFSHHWADKYGKHAFRSESVERSQLRNRTAASNSSNPASRLGFHRYAIHWTSTQITWYIDDVACYQVVENIPHQPLMMIANLAVGGNWPGDPDETTVFPAVMQIKHIKVWQTNTLK